MEQILKDFKSHLINNGKRPKTIESYVGDVKGLLKYLETKGTIFEGNLNLFYVVSYKNYLIETSYEPTTINKKINSIHSLNHYLVKRGSMDEVVIDIKRDRIKIANGSERQVEVYDEKLVDKLLFYIEDKRKVSIRDKMIVLLLLYTEVRVSELCSIKVRNIDFLTGYIKIIGKGGKLREIPLKDEVVEAIKEYLSIRCEYTHRESELLILGQRGAIKREAVKVTRK